VIQSQKNNNQYNDSTLLRRTKFTIPETYLSMITPLYSQTTAILCRRSLYYFMQEFWDEVSNDVFQPNWHLKLFCDELQTIAERVAQNKPKKYDLIVNVPPGTTKTTTFMIMFPVWCWLNWYWMRFITASYSAALSLESAEYSRDVIRSTKFTNVFKELSIKQDKDTKSNFKIIKELPDNTIKLGGNRYSTSVGGTLTGFHGHILLVDDPLDPNKAVSEVEIANANRWIDQTLSTRKIDKTITPTIMIMQRLHENDPSGHLLAKQKTNLKHISLPGEIRNYRKSLKPDSFAKNYVDDLLDPERMSWNVLKEMEADLGQYGYAGQVGQSPTPPEGGMFKVAMLSIVENLPAPTNLTGMVRAWDKAGTFGGGAYTVGLKLYRYSSGRYIIVDIIRGQWSSEERENIIRTTAETDGKDVSIVIEQEPGSGGKESAEATIRNLAGFNSLAERPTGDKAFRADPVSVQVNNGNVSMLRGDWNFTFTEELRNFPFSTYKDQTDAFSMAFHYLTKKKRARMLFSKNR